MFFLSREATSKKEEIHRHEFDGAQPSVMHRFFKKETLHGLVVVPLLTTALSFGTIDSATSTSFLTSLQSNTTENAALFDTTNLIKERGSKIDAYFHDRNMPLEGFGEKMAQVAYDNDIDWRLIPAIAVRESTGGKNACKSVKNSFLGFGSCKINFKSADSAIEIVGRNLGGNNPVTAQHYANKDTKGILQSYNPPSVVPTYAKEVMKIMNDIGEA